MWHLVKKLPWRGILLAILINAFLVGLYAMGYRSGHDSAKRDGDTALSQLQSAFDAYKTEQATLENAALRAGPDGIRSRWPPGSGLKPVILSRLLNWRAGTNNYRGKLTMSHSAGLMKR